MKYRDQPREALETRLTLALNEIQRLESALAEKPKRGRPRKEEAVDDEK